MKMQGDSIISALIGLVGAVSNNGKTEQTDRVIREAFLCLTLPSGILLYTCSSSAAPPQYRLEYPIRCVR